MEAGIARLHVPGMLESRPDFVLIIQTFQVFIEALKSRDYRCFRFDHLSLNSKSNSDTTFAA